MINSISRVKIFEFFHNTFSNNQHWNHFSYSKIDHITYLLIIANRHFSFVTKIVSIIESENQSIFRQNFQYWQFHICIWVIFDSWKFLRITFVCFANQFRLFNIDDEIDNISNSNFKFVFQNFVERVSIRIIFFFRNNCKITFNYLVNQRWFQIFAMFSIFSLSSNFDSFNFSRDIDFFNSNLSCFDFEIRQFNNVTSFLRNLEHCQKLYRYRKTKLLEYMFWIFNDSV